MIKPVGKILLVEPIREGNSSVILLNPETPQRGKVLAVGKKVSSEIQEGTIVTFATYAGTEIKDTNSLLIEEKDILTYE